MVTDLRKQLEDEYKVVISDLKFLEKQGECACKGRLKYLKNRKKDIEFAIKK